MINFPSIPLRHLPVLIFLGLSACHYPAPPSSPAPQAPLQITLQPDRPFQTIRNFGASDAWSCQFVGANWPPAQREAIADLLFSLDLRADGSPAGIGLSSWRFNIGGGSAAQGADSDIQDEWRRAESLLRADGAFDSTAQAGQRWFLRAAQARGVETFTGFVNSPPVNLTKNGKAYSSGGNSANLAPENYEPYAAFLGSVIASLQTTDGIELDYISPCNEPQWDWDKPNQEGSPWLNAEIAVIARMLDKQLQERGLDTRIELPETAQIDYLYRTHNRPGRSDQIEAFFSPASEHYIGDLDRMGPKVAAHSYFTTWDTEQLIGKRQALAEKLREFPGLEYWMSEYTLLENNPEVKGGGRDLGIDPALYLARVLHADLTVAGASAWQWWLAVSPYDYKDGLVYIDWNKTGGEIYPSKMLWALGNYARFVRPGMIRIGLERSDKRTIEEQLNGVLVSAFLDTKTGKTVSIAINYGRTAAAVQLDVDGQRPKWTLYRTSATEALQYIGRTRFSEALSLPPRSITTLVQD